MTIPRKILSLLCLSPSKRATAGDAESVTPIAATAPGASARPSLSGSAARRQDLRSAIANPGNAARADQPARFSSGAAPSATAMPGNTARAGRVVRFTSGAASTATASPGNAARTGKTVRVTTDPAPVATAPTSPAKAPATTRAGVFPVVKPSSGNSQPNRLALFGQRYDLVSHDPIALSSPWLGGANRHDWQMNLLDSFVRCSDGMVRRFPSCDGNSRNFESQMEEGMIYDADRKLIVRKEAGYAFDRKSGVGAFLVNGKPREPLPTDSGWKVFRLDDGRMLVPQPGHTACTHACEMMLLLDKGYMQVGDITAQFGDATAPHPRRDSKDVVSSLMRRTGGVAPHQRHMNLNDPAHVREMQALLAEHGPCILGGHGHVQMLDAITVKGEEVLLSIRDPFHGSATVVRRDDSLFGARYAEKLFAGFGMTREKEAGPRRLPVEATFLPSRG